MKKAEDLTGEARRATEGLDLIRASLGDLTKLPPKELLAFVDFEARVAGSLQTIAWVLGESSESPYDRALEGYEKVLNK